VFKATSSSTAAVALAESADAIPKDRGIANTNATQINNIFILFSFQAIKFFKINKIQ
jgi:hypothetical protein